MFMQKYEKLLNLNFNVYLKSTWTRSQVLIQLCAQRIWPEIMFSYINPVSDIGRRNLFVFEFFFIFYMCSVQSRSKAHISKFSIINPTFVDSGINTEVWNSKFRERYLKHPAQNCPVSKYYKGKNFWSLNFSNIK